MSIPESFLCPISHQVMEDPCIDPDGNSYERSAILDWLSTREVSPITRRPLKAGDLVPNRVLRTLIEEYRSSAGTFDTSRATEEATAPLDRKPLMLLAVIDNSGSMGESCGNNSTGEDDGLSRLDLVKHTMNTIITALAPQDKMCLIKFSNSAEVIASLTSLTPPSKKLLMQTMQDLDPEYSTNIWDGLRAALDIVASLPASTVEEYNVQVFLLTDGVPNINPPRPITETLETYLSKKCAGRRPQVHTFGYGYSLQSDVLYDLAKVANGCFGFIPDSSMVGTVFINSLSSTLVEADPTMANATIDAVTDKFCTVLRDLVVSTDMAVRFEKLEAFTAEVENRLTEARTDASDARAIDFLESLLLDCKNSSDPNLGQVAKAVQSMFFLKWGKHYLYSVLSAFEHKVCINFKDKAMQLFKSERFKVEQERVEEVFLTLPAPKPRPKPSHDQQRVYGSQRNTTAAPVSMARYHTAHGGCFTGDSVVLALRKERVVPVLVRDLQPEDTVWSQTGATRVECIVKLKYNGPVFQVENMKLTPYHPVMLGTRDLFPIEVCAGAATAHCPDYVYDLVLRNRGLIASPRQRLSGAGGGEYECMYVATFGHTVVQGRFAHAYFGSERVVHDLQAHSSWSTGRVVLEEYEFVRESDGERQVVGMRLQLSGPGVSGVEATLEQGTAVTVV